MRASMIDNASTFTFINDYDEYRTTLVQLFRKAKHSIYITFWLLDFSFPVYHSDHIPNSSFTFLDLLKETCARGVKIYILLNQNVVYPYTRPERLPKNCHFKYFPMYGKQMNWFFRRVMDLTKKSQLHYNYETFQLHQKYIAVDGRDVLLGMGDLDKKRDGSQLRSVPNQDGYIWSEMGIKLPCTKDFWEFCKNNFRSAGSASIRSATWIGSFPGINTEHQRLVQMIENSKTSLYLENQYFFGSRRMSHRILITLAQRLKKAIINNEDFRVIVITNLWFYDSNYILNLILRSNLYHTLIDFERYFISCKIPLDQVYEKIAIAYLEMNHLPIFIHSKVCIKDDQMAVVSSSNITDRSFITDKSDRELAVCFDNRNGDVSRLSNILYAKHILVSNRSLNPSFDNLFYVLQEQAGGCHLLPQKSYFSPSKQLRYYIDNLLFFGSLSFY